LEARQEVHFITFTRLAADHCGADAIVVANRGHRAALPDRLRLDAAPGGRGFDNHRRHLLSAMPTE
jgi:hypothetical protein